MATYVTATQDGVDLAGAALSRVLAEARERVRACKV
jgi:hypothetical protein